MSTIWVNASGTIPIWRTMDVLRHLFYHDLDPRIYQWLALIETKQMLETVRNTVLVRDSVTGAIQPTNNINFLLKLREEVRRLYKDMPETMNFYLPAAKIDLNKANKRAAGVIVKNGPRHYAHASVHEQAID